MSEKADPLFALPEGEAIALDLMPRKVSWDRAGATSQVELGRYVAHVTERAAPLWEAGLRDEQGA